MGSSTWGTSARCRRRAGGPIISTGSIGRSFAAAESHTADRAIAALFPLPWLRATRVLRWEGGGRMQALRLVVPVDAGVFAQTSRGHPTPALHLSHTLLILSSMMELSAAE